MERKAGKSIFIDGREYARLEDVPLELRARVESQAQGVEANKRAAPSARRQMRMSGRGGGAGEGSSGNAFLILAGVGVALLALLLYIIGS